jgi:hypothetical protein
VFCHYGIYVDRPKIIISAVHYDIAEASKLSAPKRFGKEVSDHFLGWTISEHHMSSLLTVSHEKITDIHVSCALAA